MREGAPICVPIISYVRPISVIGDAADAYLSNEIYIVCTYEYIGCLITWSVAVCTLDGNLPDS